jgi:acyl-CoA hydrolase/ribosomal protein S18 acetylase RimI-like enzyme
MDNTAALRSHIDLNSLGQGIDASKKPAWRSIYNSRLMSAESAVSPIRSGQCVFVGSNGAEPQTLVEALTARNDTLADMEIVHILTLGVAPYSDARFTDQFRHNAFFIGANVREAVNSCRADYTPIFLSEIPALIRSGQKKLDVALVMVSPPDEHGYCSLGISVDVVRAAVDCADYVVAEVNPNMPRTHGDSFLHVAQIGAFVESSRSLLELAPPTQSETVQRIARHIADLIEDGSTLQVGIGAIPDAVLANLTDKHDLGIHTEMFSDGIMALIDSGAITGKRKSLHRGKVVATFCMGSRALYNYVDNNPVFAFYPTEYVNDPFVVAQNDKMVSINAAIEIDLTGQVCSDSLGTQFYSGIGGQVDFVRGAARSREGKAIIAFPSTASPRNGATYSRIVPTLKQGAGVVTSRGDVHYVVTEWGTAYLHGKSIRERALALIRISHPDFRRELLAAARERCLVQADQTDTALATRYPEEFEQRVALSEGTPVLLRPIRPGDEELLREFHYQLSEETILHRYGYLHSNLPHNERLKLVNVDYENTMAVVAIKQCSGREEMLGVVRYTLDERTRLAEFALIVRDDWQGKHVGTALLDKIIEVASIKGLAGLVATVHSNNIAMIDLLLSQNFTVLETRDNTIRLVLRR